MDIIVEAYLGKCKALINAIGRVQDEDDREALLWILEENFAKLEDSIEKSQMK